jgi:ParB family chromosome partitioning protein
LDFFLTEDRGVHGSAAPPDASEHVQQVEVGTLVPNPAQPRRDFADDELRELSDSIRSSGVLQPILARPAAGGGLQIIAGERRWRAAKLAGLERVPTIVRAVTDEQAAVFALVENLHRTDLNAVEKARAMRSLQEATGVSTDDLAHRLGLDRSTVANFLRLLELPGEVLALVSRGTLTMGHARALLGLANEDEQRTLAEDAVRRRLSVRQVEELVQALRKHGEPPPAAAGPQSSRRPPKEAWVREIEDTLARALQSSIQVRYGRRRSKITIECRSREEFERVYDKLRSLTES